MKAFLVWLIVCVSVVADTHYVDINSSSPTSPYTNWATAAVNIQDAVDASESGDTVLVADGLYNTGSRVAPDQVLCGNRVVIDKAVAVRSVNGAGSAIIEGQGPRGDTAIRGVWMVDGALLDGFTVTNGHTTVLSDDEDNGGGVYCTSTDALIENSIIVSNSATDGGALYYGTLDNCTIIGNSASHYGGGSYYGTLNNCTVSGNDGHYNGGGMSYGTANNCTINGNHASWGGAMYNGTANNCTVSSNSASTGGGAMYNGTANNCTVSSNSASTGGGSYYGTLNNCTVSGNTANDNGGGSYYGTLNNCTVSGNTANDNGGGTYSGTLNNCTISGNTANDNGGGSYYGTLKNCIIYDNGPTNVSSTANLSICYTNDPHFISTATGNYRLSASSPCRDAGLNAFVTTTNDLDGNPRIVNGTVDIGAYEYQGADLYFITASAGAHGAVLPAGQVNALAGTNITFTISPDSYYDTADVLTNGVSLGLAGSATFVWNDINADGNLDVTFEARIATNNIPEWWLAQYGWTSGFDSAAMADTDGDGYKAWEEYILGCNPTDDQSSLHFNAGLNGGAYRLSFLTVAGRIYLVEYANSLTGNDWNEYLSLEGFNGEINLNDHNIASNRFYRVKVDLME